MDMHRCFYSQALHDSSAVIAPDLYQCAKILCQVLIRAQDADIAFSDINHCLDAIREER